jgi:uncharacterized protein YecT (DUF1311 family)
MNNLKRNKILSGIEQRQNPLPSSDDVIGAAYEIRTLDHYLQNPRESTPALRQLVPVRVVACIEGCLKAATAELINHGDPYLGNARKLFQQVKIDFDVLRAVLDDRVSLGEIIAHSLGWHDMAEINARMTAILSFDFFEKLKETEDRWEIEINQKPKKPVIASLSKVLADIDDALKFRHALCHETRLFQPVSAEDAERFLESGRMFTSAAAWLVSETLQPNAPLTQTDMNIDAAQRATALGEELKKEIALLFEKLDDEDNKLLTKSQDAWRDYCAAFSELESNAAKGGSMQPMLYAGCVATITRDRILEIKECLRQEGLCGKAKRRQRPR